tara:strand:- start:27 stop:476 length:450 start_codon:yes stop_codon:yes gene_type:complete
MFLINKISDSIKNAMKSKDSISLESLRAIKSSLLLAKTQKGASNDLSESEEIKILQKLVKQRKESADIYMSQNRNDLAETELRQAKIIEKFLPDQLELNEIESIISELIIEIDADGMKDMGKVMGLATKKLSGKADGKTISNIVRSKLS